MSIESGEVHDWPPVTSAHASRGQPDATRSLAVRPVASIQSARLTTVLGSVSRTRAAFEPKVEGSCNNTHDAPRAGRAEARWSTTVRFVTRASYPPGCRALRHSLL